MSLIGPWPTDVLTELEHDRQAIRKTCLKAMKARKSKHTERVNAARLLADLQGFIVKSRTKAQPRAGRPKSSLESPADRTLGTLLKVG